MLGTAPEARTWWLVEASGPWGANAVGQSRVPGIADLASGPERRVLLVRPTVRSPRSIEDGRIWVAHSGRVRRLCLPPGVMPAQVPPVPPEDYLDDDPLAPTVALCTNAKRDPCCGVRGRELIRQVGARPALWECSHLGGHRFAPTALHVPSGRVFGRLDAAALSLLLASADGTEVDLQHHARGISAVAPLLQVAWASAPDAFDVAIMSQDDDHAVAGAIGRDGTTREMHLRRSTLGAWPLSCGKPPEVAQCWQVVDTASQGGERP